MLLTNCRYVITQDKNREILENADILIQDCKIKSIIKSIAKNTNENDVKNSNKVITSNKIIDCSDKIVMSGLINMHTHIAMHSLRGICDDEELDIWLKKVVNEEKKFDETKIKENCVNAVNEMINYGTTTFVDMYYPIKPVIDAVKKTNIRAVLAPSIYNFVGEEKKQFNEIKWLLEKNNEKCNSEKNDCNLIKLAYGLHSIYACSEEMLKKVKKNAKDNLILIHIAETRKERVECLKKNGKLPIEYLNSIGFLGENVIVIHAIWLTKGELDLINKAKTKVVHCPVSNMKLASGGVMPLTEMHNRNIIVGLGTDSVASNNNLDMFEEMKVCGLLHKQHRWDATVAPVQKIIDMATIDAARILNMDIGSIEIGKKADIITLKIENNLYDTNKKNILSNIVYNASGHNVCDVIINGEKVK